MTKAFTWQEDHEIQFLKEAYRTIASLDGTDWEDPASQALEMETDPTITRSLEPRRRFLARIVLHLPEPFTLPPSRLVDCLHVTYSVCSRVIQYWVKLGLLEVVGKEGKLRLFRRRLLQNYPRPG
jgi:hypothetical protein